MNSKRTSKLTIIARMAIIPFLVTAFWGLMLSIADTSLGFYLVLGGLVALVLGIGFLWAFTNFFTFLLCPKEYRIWKAGGGDPFFDSLDSPINNDPPSVKLQELYREKARQDWEANFGPLPTPSPPQSADFTITLDDPL
jgi:hypothetical protein